MLFTIRPFHRFFKKYDISHHHVLIVWALLSVIIPITAITVALGTSFSSVAQALSLAVMGLSFGVFFFILLEAEESKIESEKNKKTDCQ